MSLDETLDIGVKFTGKLGEGHLSITEEKLAEEQLEKYRQGRVRSPIAQWAGAEPSDRQRRLTMKLSDVRYGSIVDVEVLARNSVGSLAMSLATRRALGPSSATWPC